MEVIQNYYEMNRSLPNYYLYIPMEMFITIVFILLLILNK